MNELKVLFSAHQCELKRIRASRHWQATGEHDALLIVATSLNDSDDPKLQRVRSSILKALLTAEAHLPSISFRVKNIISTLPKQDVTQLKQACIECSIHYKRVYRTAHVDLIGNGDQLAQLYWQLSLQSCSLELRKQLDVLAKHLAKHNVNLHEIDHRPNLIEMIKEQPNITLNELVSKTGCSLMDARQAFDDFEFNC